MPGTPSADPRRWTQRLLDRVRNEGRPTDLFACHRIRLCDGSWLAIGSETFRGAWRLVPAQDDDDAPRLVLCVPKHRPQASFLLSPDGRPICLVGDHLRGPAISGHAVADGPPTTLRLRHPLAGSYLGLRPTDGPRPATIVFDHRGDGDDLTAVTLHRHPVAADHLGPKARRLLARLAAFVTTGISATATLALLRERRVPRALAEAVLRTLPVDELTQAGARLVASERDRALLRRCLPDDPWLARRLPDVVRWIEGGRPAAAILSAPAAQDPLLRVNKFHGGPSIGFTLHALARRAVPPRRQSAAFTKVRNDGAYLLDWIAYHRALGFDHLFIYSNDNDDGSDALLAQLARHGVITWVQSEIVAGTSPQDKANNHILNLVPQVLDYRWLLTIDSDEYLGLDERFDGIGAYLGWQESRPVDAIALCWLLYGARDTDGYRDASSVERFSLREARVNHHVKCLARPNRFWGQHPHFPYAPLDEPFAFRTEAGRIHLASEVTGRSEALAERPTADHAWINHYIFRSCLELCWKLTRGRADWDESTASKRREYLNFAVSAFLSLSDPAQVVEDRRSQSRLPRHGREHARLLALPGLAEADAAIKASFAGRLRAASRAFVEGPDSGEHPRFREIVAAALAASP